MLIHLPSLKISKEDLPPRFDNASDLGVLRMIVEIFILNFIGYSIDTKIAVAADSVFQYFPFLIGNVIDNPELNIDVV